MLLCNCWSSHWVQLPGLLFAAMFQTFRIKRCPYTTARNWEWLSSPYLHCSLLVCLLLLTVPMASVQSPKLSIGLEPWFSVVGTWFYLCSRKRGCPLTNFWPATVRLRQFLDHCSRWQRTLGRGCLGRRGEYRCCARHGKKSKDKIESGQIGMMLRTLRRILTSAEDKLGMPHHANLFTDLKDCN